MSDIASIPTPRHGRCLCGAVRFATSGDPLWVAHCHCESCRRATSTALATYAGFDDHQVTWSGAPPGEYRSSAGVVRRFCRACGSPLSYAGGRWPGETHLFVVCFDDPGRFTPGVHVNVGEQVPWLHLADGLPRFAQTAKDGPALDA